MAEEHKKLDTPENAASPEQGEAKKEPETLEGMLYCWAQALITAVVGVVLLFTFAFRLIGVSGPSMQDTLYTGDRLLVLNAAFCDFQPGDVVVINNYNADLSDTLIKRIIAVGGQTIDIDLASSTVYVDGQPLDEPYVKGFTDTIEGTRFPLTLAEDEVFVMGDHRDHSTDSRSARLGPVKEGYLQGKAVLLLLPGTNPDLGAREWDRIGLVR
ncbi:MAG: signal peptidase I [Oscillospiraceae bacterium]|jgi:signal peptidase I|nr:signal peptidase I [Oscillospiraceae bacterium]